MQNHTKPTNPSSAEPLLTITQAARYLRVSPDTLRRWEKKGYLTPHRTPGGQRRYTRSQLDNLLNLQPPIPTTTKQTPSKHIKISLNKPSLYLLLGLFLLLSLAATVYLLFFYSPQPSTFLSPLP